MSDAAFLRMVFVIAVGIIGLAAAATLSRQSDECHERGGVMVDDGAFWWTCVEPKK